MEHLIY